MCQSVTPEAEGRSTINCLSSFGNRITDLSLHREQRQHGQPSDKRAKGMVDTGHHPTKSARQHAVIFICVHVHVAKAFGTVSRRGSQRDGVTSSLVVESREALRRMCVHL